MFFPASILSSAFDKQPFSDQYKATIGQNVQGFHVDIVPRSWMELRDFGARGATSSRTSRPFLEDQGFFPGMGGHADENILCMPCMMLGHSHNMYIFISHALMNLRKVFM